MAWQRRLYDEFLGEGQLPALVDVPTGLGKTAFMALWLIARGQGIPLPRRLVYVVDRRAVVDQATTFAERLRERLGEPSLARLRAGLGLEAEAALPISTLRGQHADNREWLEDPSASAIVVGTVDMVGSRLLFEGYGVSRKMRPYQAGLLGSDTVVVLDEAHLVPPFEELLADIELRSRAEFGPSDEARRAFIPRFRLVSLSATGYARGESSFRLGDADVAPAPDPTGQRLNAKKGLQIVPPSDDAIEARLAMETWRLAREGERGGRYLVFCNSRDVAVKVHKELRSLLRGKKAAVELFTGARRVFEREALAKKLEELGFMPTSNFKGPELAFLVATSAAEVGVDLDADHMVCDLCPWERLVQRLGRVNRRGELAGGSDVIVIDQKKNERPTSEATRMLLLEHLPTVSVLDADEARDVSPNALRKLREAAKAQPTIADLIATASTPQPLRPALTLALLQAWSMTSLEQHAGRPEVAPWLRGWLENDPPQTRVVWRALLPIRVQELVVLPEVKRFFEAAPPHLTEVLETDTGSVVKWLLARLRKVDKGLKSAPLVVLSPAGEVQDVLTGSRVLAQKDPKKFLERTLSSATLVVDARFGGLEAGMLSDKMTASPLTLDSEPDESLGDSFHGDLNAPAIAYRVLRVPADDGLRDQAWRETYRFPLEVSGETVTTYLVVEKWKTAASNEDSRAIGPREQRLDAHQDWAGQEAVRLAQRLNLPVQIAAALRVAARLHDEGKQAEQWQRAFRAPRLGGPYAKTKGPIDQALLDGYRHEFGSLPLAMGNAEFLALDGSQQDLVLHLIASHHGHARPTIPTRGCKDAPPSMLQERAAEVALRYVRLQRAWGPWGLAYLEALLRAADQRASRRNEEGEGA